MADNNQLIITISREYGSLGHLIADKLGEELGMPVLDRAFFFKMAENHGINPKFIHAYDEKKRNVLLTRTRRGHSNSMEDIVADMIAKYIRELAETGDSFIIVGRSAQWVLRDYDNLIRVFVAADFDTKVERIMEHENVEKEEAQKIVKKNDKKREKYFEYYTGLKWKDADNYDIMIDSAKIGVDGAEKIIRDFVDIWTAAGK